MSLGSKIVWLFPSCGHLVDRQLPPGRRCSECNNLGEAPELVDVEVIRSSGIVDEKSPAAWRGPLDY